MAEIQKEKKVEGNKKAPTQSMVIEATVRTDLRRGSRFQIFIEGDRVKDKTNSLVYKIVKKG